MAVRMRFTGNTDAAKAIVSIGKKVLSDLTKDMAFNNLQQNKKFVQLADGTSIRVQRVFGQDTIDIDVPVVEVEKKEVEEEITSTPAYRIKLFNWPVAEDEILTTECLMRMTFYHRDATAIDDETKIVFDYKVPDDTDEDGNLVTSPEEYFGSEDNPGLDWDDDNECFVVDTKFFEAPYLGNALSYATALGADELKHFVTYSCMHCVEEETKGKYYPARQDQQYEEITDEDERWEEESLIEPSFSTTEILEDKIACLIGFNIMATLGDWRVIWDAVYGGYAQGIINDDGDVIEDADWPVLDSTLNDWVAGTDYKGFFNFGAWGTPCTEQTITDCEGYGISDDVDCEIADYYVTECMQQYVHTYEAKLLGAYPHYSYTYTYMSLCTAGFGGSIPVCRSYFGELNDFDVFFRWQATKEDNMDIDSSDANNGVNSGHVEEYVTFVTPWGNIFEDLLWVYSDTELTTTEGSGSCTGEQVFWWHKVEVDSDERIMQIIYQSENIIFGLAGGFYHKIQYKIQDTDCFTPDYTDVVAEDWDMDALGVINFYPADECLTVDPNEMGVSEDIKEGFINLLQAYFDAENAGDPQLYSISFWHREGVV